MFKKRSVWKGGSRSADTEILGFLGEGASLEGELVLKGDFKVDGKIVGRVTSPSSLIVGPTGEVVAEELRARSLSVSGSVRGVLNVDELLEIQPGGKVLGRVRMKKRGLVIAPGGEFDGTVEIVGGDEVEGRGHGPAFLEAPVRGPSIEPS